VISGFNTDVEFSGTVYHIQTEDKGVKSRLIVSLVYDGGTILASKRLSYDDFLDNGVDEKALADRVNRQHKLICAAVRAGRINELKALSSKTNGRAASYVVAKPDVVAARTSTSDVSADPIQPAVITVEPPVPKPLKEVNGSNSATSTAGDEVPADPFADAPIIDDVSVIDEAETILPAEAVAVVADLSRSPRPANEKLRIELLTDSRLKGGDRQTLSVMLCSGSEGKVVSNAEIMIKVIGSSFRPVIFHARSDANGIAKFHLQLPHFQVGRAALLVRAMTGGEEIELRRAVVPG
jgi:hypothetical protein